MWIPTTGWLPSSSYAEPVTIPSTEPGDEPTVCIRVNETWVPYILGSLSQLTQPTTWVSTGAGSIQTALDKSQGLLDIIATSGPCSAANAALFNGEDNYLSIGPASQFDFHAGGGFSITAWLYSAGVGGIWSQDRNTGGGTGLTFDLFTSGTNRNLLCAINNGVTQVIAQTGNMLFSMVAVTYDGTNIRLFYNGSLISTTACTINPAYSSSQPAQIGRVGTGSYFCGIMRDIALYAGRVPDADIATIYSNGGGVSAGTTLNGHWLLNEGAGTTAADSSGHGNTATLHGSAPLWGTWP